MKAVFFFGFSAQLLWVGNQSRVPPPWSPPVYGAVPPWRSRQLAHFFFFFCALRCCANQGRATRGTFEILLVLGAPARTSDMGTHTRARKERNRVHRIKSAVQLVSIVIARSKTGSLSSIIITCARRLGPASHFQLVLLLLLFNAVVYGVVAASSVRLCARCPRPTTGPNLRIYGTELTNR